MSKFIFNFLSCFSSDETDVIIAPLSSESLASICQALSLKKVDDISLEDLQILGIFSNCFSTISSSSMEDINDLKEGESKLIPINMITNCSEDELDVKEEAAFKSKEGLSEKTDSDNSVVCHTEKVGETAGVPKTRKRKRYPGLQESCTKYQS